MKKQLNQGLLEVLFVDQTNQIANPKLLGKSFFSFTPVFNVGDKVSFANFKKNALSEEDALINKVTHKVKNVHWSFTIIQDEDEKEQNSALPILVVSLEEIKEVKSVSKIQIRNAFH